MGSTSPGIQSGQLADVRSQFRLDIETELEVVRYGFTNNLEAQAANLRRRGANGLFSAAVA